MEILSPYTSKKDLNEKFRLYERQGVREYWIVNHESRYIRVFVLGKEGKYDAGTLVLYEDLPDSQNRVKSSVLEGFSVTLQELFD